MTSIAIVTPWWEAHELLSTYNQALYEGPVRPGDCVIVVDNGSIPPLEQTLAESTTPINLILREQRNRGFSRACNRGYRAAADFDAVLFLNNDVRATGTGWLDVIRANLRPGMLVGAQVRTDPHTMVDGHLIPYLDGWCIAGLRETWERVCVDGAPWDETYEEPAYWGDNDLCLRARHAGVGLSAVSLPLEHRSNYSSRRMRVDEVSARNHAKFVARARELGMVRA